MSLWTILVQKEMYQKRNIAHPVRFLSGMWSHGTGMNFKVFIQIIARSHYFSNNNVTGMLHFTEQLIITIFVQKMTIPHVICSRHKHPPQTSTSRSPFSGLSSKTKRNSRNGTSYSALGWSFLDQQPSLPPFSEQSGST